MQRRGSRTAQFRRVASFDCGDCSLGPCSRQPALVSTVSGTRFEVGGIGLRLLCDALGSLRCFNPHPDDLLGQAPPLADTFRRQAFPSLDETLADFDEMFPLVDQTLAHIGVGFPCVRDAIALIRSGFALIGESIPLVGYPGAFPEVGNLATQRGEALLTNCSHQLPGGLGALAGKLRPPPGCLGTIHCSHRPL